MSPDPSEEAARVASTLRVILAAMAGGIALLAVVVGLFYARRTTPGPVPQVLLILSAIDAFYFVAGWTASAALFRVVSRPGTTASYQTASIIRAAAREGSALLGLVACFLGAQNGALRAQPLLWLNAFPALLFVSWTLLTLPDEGAVRARIQDAAAGLRGPTA